MSSNLLLAAIAGYSFAPADAPAAIASSSDAPAALAARNASCAFITACVFCETLAPAALAALSASTATAKLGGSFPSLSRIALNIFSSWVSPVLVAAAFCFSRFFTWASIAFISASAALAVAALAALAAAALAAAVAAFFSAIRTFKLFAFDLLNAGASSSSSDPSPPCCDSSSSSSSSGGGELGGPSFTGSGAGSATGSRDATGVTNPLVSFARSAIRASPSTPENPSGVKRSVSNSLSRDASSSKVRGIGTLKKVRCPSVRSLISSI